MTVAEVTSELTVTHALEVLRKAGVKSRYDNYYGGAFHPPVSGKYFTSVSPINQQLIGEFARSTAEDVEKAIDAAEAVGERWADTSIAERSALLMKVADTLEKNLDLLAAAETIDNGKPIRETLNADIPLVVDHFRYFAAAIRAEEGTIGEIDHDTVAYHFKEPMGIVGQIIPWNFPLLMAAWKLAPALAAGNRVVIKPASNTPLSIMIFAQLVGDILPPGVLNVVTGPGGEMGKSIAANKRISKVAFTGETVTGRLIMQYASEPIIPQTLELGGKSPNIFFADVMDENDDFLDKALEGFALFAFNKGEVCTCPSRVLVQESIFDKFMEKAVARVQKIKVGNSLDPETQMGPQVSVSQMENILKYIKIGKDEGATLLTGGDRAHLDGELEKGNFVQPTIFVGNNKMRIFQEEIFGPVVSVTKFKDLDDAIRIGNDTLYGLGAGVWSRNVNNLYKVGRGIKAGRVWTNCYHVYPAGATFGGYKESGFGRETHKIMLDHYQQTKCMLLSYSTKAQGFF
ncbi:MAG: aldehyde dehydrogenase [Acidobacteriota bacterium]|nr:aldehyde dehydrogenase [Acidobacteriota bacterium]